MRETVDCTDWDIEGLQAERYQMFNKTQSANDIQVGGEHYKNKKTQPWDVMEEWFSQEEFVGFLKGNVLKYVARYKDKNGVEDLKKAQHYLAKLIETLETES